MDVYLSRRLSNSHELNLFLTRETDDATRALQDYHDEVQDFMLKAVSFFAKKDSGKRIYVDSHIHSKPEGVARSEFIFRYPQRGRAVEMELTVRPLMSRVNLVIIGVNNREALNRHIQVQDDNANETLEEIWRLVVNELIG